MQTVKAKIKILENDICEGNQTRAKLRDRIEGEKLSIHLLSEEKNRKCDNIIYKLTDKDGRVYDSIDNITYYVLDYYKELYKRENCDEDIQNIFLEKIESKITNSEKEILSEGINDLEIKKAVEELSDGKSPGMDGLPIEFYKTNWNIIKDELKDVIKYSMSNSKLAESQNKGVIRLIPKESNTENLDGWRPITLLNADYKIIAKILANRMKIVMKNIISNEQYCGVEDRSIISCNNRMRDIISYCDKEEKEAAIMSLVWKKAFDRVDQTFLFKILKKMDFPDKFIDWIKMLYIDCRSSLLINIRLTIEFNVDKSVRQGCPLAMLLYIIYQEPLYMSIKQNMYINKLSLPNNEEQCIQGYADDSTLIIVDSISLINMEKEISLFEKASGSVLNKNKTFIMGIGAWRDSHHWDLSWLKTVNCLKILGIQFCSSYKNTVERNCEIIKLKIEKRTNILSSRMLTLFQRNIIISAMVMSKLWYICHTLHIPQKYVKSINSIVYKYIWNGRYQPISRETLYLPKDQGGIGAINIQYKAVALLTSSAIKDILDERKLTLYFCQIRLSYIIKTTQLSEVSFVANEYYSEIIACIRKICKVKQFPKLNSKEIYCSIISPKVPNVVHNYPLFNWNVIWSRLNMRFLGLKEKEVCFRFLHDTLATNVRLKMLNIRQDDNCISCDEREESMHIFYCCKHIKEIVLYFKLILNRCCNIWYDNFMRVIMFDFNSRSKKDEYTAVLLIVDYIYCIWISRIKEYNNIRKKEFLFWKIRNTKHLILNILKDNSRKVSHKGIFRYLDIEY